MWLRTIVAINSLAVLAVAPQSFTMGDAGLRAVDRQGGTAEFAATFSPDTGQVGVTNGSNVATFERVDANVEPRMRSTELFAAAFNPANNQLSIANGSQSGTSQLTTSNSAAVAQGGGTMFAPFTQSGNRITVSNELLNVRPGGSGLVGGSLDPATNQLMLSDGTQVGTFQLVQSGGSTVSAAEPFTMLAVGLGLIGFRMLCRRT